MNRQAQLLISDLGPHTSEAPQPNQRTDVLPPALVDLLGEILSLFETRHEKNGNGQFVIRHVAAKSGNPVLVRGVGCRMEVEKSARASCFSSREPAPTTCPPVLSRRRHICNAPDLDPPNPFFRLCEILGGLHQQPGFSATAKGFLQADG